MFKLLDSIASIVGIFMYLTFKQVLRSRKGLGKVLTTTLCMEQACVFIRSSLCLRITTLKEVEVATKCKEYEVATKQRKHGSY